MNRRARARIFVGLLIVAAAAAFAFAPRTQEKSMSSSPPPAHTNRLIDATSPYLQQHAHNPVDWYEWGPAALEKAKSENKPIFLSIGYAACHWCHVMAHESFQSEAIAEVMNEHFVNIKVDREERPDLDAIYMQATVIINQGQGGWPMSVWLTPTGEPFFAGTYFPPDSRWGRPGFRQLCERIGQLWKDDPEALRADATKLAGIIDQSMSSGATGDAQLTLEHVDRACDTLAQHFDAQRGGISGGGTNKFPPSMTLQLFMRSAQRRGLDQPNSATLLNHVRTTLDAMARGGIYDQLAGGIHRYSTDVEWHVPHFEKMLYDQALVSSAYIDGWLLLRETLYRDIARSIFDYVLDDLRHPDGGFYSTRDADTEGEEGKYYVWTHEEIVAALGEQEAALFNSYYDVRPRGNWQDPHAPEEPKNVLRIIAPLEQVAQAHEVPLDQAEQRLAAAREKLLAVRAERTAPGLDDKILAEWNGLMIASLARGGAAFDEPRYIDAAVRAADFILSKQRTPAGRLQRAWRDGRLLETAFLTDYAAMIDGLLELFEATGDQRWLREALALNNTCNELFYDEANGGYFFTPSDHEQLITRAKDFRDNATPSGNSVQLMNLLRLAVLTGDDDHRRRAEQTVAAFAKEISGAIGMGERFLAGVDFAHSSPVEIAILGERGAPETAALLRTVYDRYLPNRVLVQADAEAASTAADVIPLLRERTLVDGKPTAYVCENYACQAPVTAPQELRAQLDAASRR